MERRDFVKKTGAAIAIAGSSGLFPNVVFGKKSGKYRLAIIGSGWWGMNILREAIAHGSGKVVGMCDVDQKFLDAGIEEVKRLTGDTPRKYKDFRELLGKEEPDITIIATPDHWHALTAITAMEAGSHVYLEKPISHTINEGKAIVAAQKRTGKVIQVGLHRHICPHNISGINFISSGKVGEIYAVKAFAAYQWEPSIIAPNSEPPPGLDWDMWIGPAPYRNYNRGIHPTLFRYYLDFANGVISDWGVHWFDQILWWSEEKHPRRIYSTGKVFESESAEDTPDYQTATFEFESYTATWEHRKHGGNGAEKARVGVYFYGTLGVFHMGWLDGWTFYPVGRKAKPIHEKSGVHEPDGQNIKELWGDFIRAIENKKTPVANIENSFNATNMSLLAMISYNTGRIIEWDGEKQTILNDPEAVKLMQREYRTPWEYPEF